MIPASITKIGGDVPVGKNNNRDKKVPSNEVLEEKKESDDQEFFEDPLGVNKIPKGKKAPGHSVAFLDDPLGSQDFFEEKKEESDSDLSAPRNVSVAIDLSAAS
eukprot:96321_1